MNKSELIKRVDQLLYQGRKVLATKKSGEYTPDYVDNGLQKGFRASALSFIKSLYGLEHPYYDEFNKSTNDSYLTNTENGINILKSIKDEIENDWLISFKQLASAEIFADFLEMSKYLLDSNYKDAAAVMIGSVLEEHLRLLCKSNSIATTCHNNSGVLVPKKADLMNADLMKANIYNVLIQKNVTAWLDLRNKAAHGNYQMYSKDQVDLMYQGVLNFVTTTK